MRVLHLITARGGSKGIPRKNLQEIAGLSLIGYRAIAARRSAHCARLIISTDCKELAAEAVRHGAEDLFRRPPGLATDTATSMDVVLHAMEWVRGNLPEPFDAVLLHQPSVPFATAEDFDRAMALLAERPAAQAVIGVGPAAGSALAGPMDAQGGLSAIVEKVRALRERRRQDLAGEVRINGALYLARWDFLERHRDFYADPAATLGLPMPAERSVDIDEPLDLEWARFLAGSGRLDLSPWR